MSDWNDAPMIDSELVEMYLLMLNNHAKPVNYYVYTILNGCAII